MLIISYFRYNIFGYKYTNLLFDFPSISSSDETFQNDPRFWQYNRRFAEGIASESPDSGNATNGMPNDNAVRPKTEGGVRPRPSFKYNRYVTRDA